MKIGELVSRFLHLCSVPSCISCTERLDFRDMAYCPECYKKFEAAKMNDCSRCAKPLPECSCTNDFLKTHFVKGLVKVFRYRPSEKENAPENMLVYFVKREERYDVMKRAVKELRMAIENSYQVDGNFVFTSVGELVAKRAAEKGITAVVFDRGGFLYHGKIKALADAAREAGLQF